MCTAAKRCDTDHWAAAESRHGIWCCAAHHNCPVNIWRYNCRQLDKRTHVDVLIFIRESLRYTRHSPIYLISSFHRIYMRSHSLCHSLFPLYLRLLLSFSSSSPFLLVLSLSSPLSLFAQFESVEESTLNLIRNHFSKTTLQANRRLIEGSEPAAVVRRKRKRFACDAMDFLEIIFDYFATHLNWHGIDSCKCTQLVRVAEPSSLDLICFA